MVDLFNVCGLPIGFDTETSGFVLGGEVTFAEEHSVPLSDIIPILLNKYLRYPEVVYTQKRDLRFKGSASTEVTYDLIHIPYGLLGIEYVKTHVYYSDFVENKFDCIIEVLQGELTLIIQKNMPREDEWQLNTFVEDLSIVTLKKGNKFAIPTGYFYTFINTGSSPLIISKLNSFKGNTSIDYDILKREKGLACYIISKNAKVETVANPKYKIPHKLKATSGTTYMEKKSNDQNQKNIFKTKDPLAKIIDKVKHFVIL